MQTIVFFDIDSTLVENRFSPKAISEVLAEVEAASGKSFMSWGARWGWKMRVASRKTLIIR